MNDSDQMKSRHGHVHADPVFRREPTFARVRPGRPHVGDGVATLPSDSELRYMNLVRAIDGGGRSIGFLPNGGGDERDIFHVEFDPAVEPVVGVVVNAVAVIKDADPMELRPLSDSIDPDVLEDLLGQSTVRTADVSSEITFEYEGFEVTVNSDGHVWLARSDAGE